ncbi:glycosyltransferase [Methylomonas rivi]|uniref:Glycosyltransferase n=1 Tax=Methylomonas rivi TaxID=2952226 RepID=A0ABT1U762_9GAMM|nr:glycosyltransferase [Methylomonas sp. WSC-6]MCQ8129627.1 glycosyltransferase [Methylomonas sp. WSC-6]
MTKLHYSQHKILFIHENFPAQFGGFADWLTAKGWDVKYATAKTDVGAVKFDVVNFKAHRGVTAGQHHYLTGYEKAIINAQAFARMAVDLSKQGYRPDIIVAHSGWGVGSFAKDVWPGSKYVPYFEWYYSWPPKDRSRHDLPSDFLDGRAKARVRNSPMWLDFSSADAAICPTKYQAEQFPLFIRDMISVMPDGVDTDLHCPGSRDEELLSRIGIPRDARVLTYLARGMEPTRGFPEMMEAVAKLQQRGNDFHTIIVGSERVAYGRKLESGSWKQRMIEDLDLDLSRVHFTGLVSRKDMISIFQSSDVHLYLTVPFVLSWSMLEAMSCGCLLVASDTDPVREFLKHGDNALLVDMNNTEELVSMLEHALSEGEALKVLRHNARDFASREFDAKSIAYPRKMKFLEQVISS